MKNIKIIIAAAIAICVITAGIIYITMSYSDNDIVYEQTESVAGDEESTAFSGEEGTSAGGLYVYVCGQVNNPGVVMTELGARVYEAVELAGGFTEEADINAVNQAEMLTDGQQIYIPAIGEDAAVDGSSLNGDNGLININTADAAKLMELPGVGQSRADSIIQYREENGKFNSIEDIMNISGIKEASFQKIKDLICV